jgi:dihydrofolate reductase
MIISLIAAMANGRVIGQQGKLPWHIPADLARFKATTMGQTLLMGRKTFESIGHPLPGRTTIVLSRSVSRIEGCLVARSLSEAITAANGAEELFVCGGGALYREALPLCQRIYLTIVHGSYQGDVRFPEIPDSFLELLREERPQLLPPLSFVVYERVGQLEPGTDAKKLREKGVEAMQLQLYFLARRCFEQALAHAASPEVASDLAFCQAKSGAPLPEALQSAELALVTLPENARCLFNLGRIQILAGEREKGLATLRKGVQLPNGKEFQAELERMGTRKPPPIRSLSRNHPLNKYLGIMLQRMGLR